MTQIKILPEQEMFFTAESSPDDYPELNRIAKDRRKWAARQPISFVERNLAQEVEAFNG